MPKMFNGFIFFSQYYHIDEMNVLIVIRRKNASFYVHFGYPAQFKGSQRIFLFWALI